MIRATKAQVRGLYKAGLVDREVQPQQVFTAGQQRARERRVAVLKALAAAMGAK